MNNHIVILTYQDLRLTSYNYQKTTSLKNVFTMIATRDTDRFHMLVRPIGAILILELCINRLYHIISYNDISYHIKIYHMVAFFPILYSIILNYIIFHYIILYCIGLFGYGE